MTGYCNNTCNNTSEYNTRNNSLQESPIYAPGRFVRDTVRPTSRTHIMIETIDEDKPPPSAPRRNNWNDFYDCRNDHIEHGTISQAYVVHPHHNSTAFNYDPYLTYEEESHLGSASRPNKNNLPYNPSYTPNNYQR